MADNYSMIDDLAEEAENAPELTLEQLRAANPTQPNRTKSEMLTCRLNADTMRQIEKLAAQRDLPVSALVRGWILQGLAADQGDSVPHIVNRLTVEVDRLKQRLG